jgi:ADYC domain
MRRGSILLAALASTALAGCVLGEDDEFDLSELDDEEIGEDSYELSTTNGMSLNGMSLNGMSLNGMSLNGRRLNGMSLNGMSLNGMSLNGMSLNGSALSGKKASGQTVTGSALVGARLKGQLDSGSTIDLRIDAAATLPAPNSDVWAYTVRYALADGTWAPLCGTSGGAPVQALALAGTWNYGVGVEGGGSWTASSTSFTFACRATALAKCVEFGYKPWKTVGGVQLRNHHQACTRMLRADYCGNGRAWTQDGTLINVYDGLGIQTDAATWKVDAEWLPTGARCYHSLRDFQVGKPVCKTEIKSSQCGDFTKGALLITEYK